MAGFDCSGLVVEVLQAVGVLPRGDWTAEGLRAMWSEVPEEMLSPMDLVFFLAADGRATHVEFVAEPTTLMIGASGGGRLTTTTRDAEVRDAFVKLRPRSSRSSECELRRPTYGRR